VLLDVSLWRVSRALHYPRLSLTLWNPFFRLKDSPILQVSNYG